MNLLIDYADLIDWLNTLNSKAVKILVVDMCPCKSSQFLKYISEKYIFSTYFEKGITASDINEIQDLLKQIVLNKTFSYESSWGIIDTEAEKLIDVPKVLEIYNSSKNIFLHGKLETTIRFLELCKLLQYKSSEYISDLFDYACWFYPSNEFVDELISIVASDKPFKHHVDLLNYMEKRNLVKMGFKLNTLKNCSSRRLHNILKFCDLSEHSCRNFFYLMNGEKCKIILKYFTQ